MDLLRDFDIAVPIYKVATDADGAREIAEEFGMQFVQVFCYPNATTLHLGLFYRKSVCLLSVCLSVVVVHTSQGLELLAIFLHHYVPWPSPDFRSKFYRDHPTGTPPSGALNARGVANRVILDLLKAISHKWYMMWPQLQLMTNWK